MRTRAAGGIALALLSAIACTDRSPQPPTPPIATRVGWIDSGCLAIANDSLADRTPVTVAVLGGAPRTVDALVQGRASGAAGCPPRRSAAEASPELRFYELAPAVEVGIGVVGSVSRIDGGMDVDGDRRPEAFTRCTASEGISFAVWSTAPYTGEPLWSGYEYLGYDTEPDCPRR